MGVTMRYSCPVPRKTTPPIERFYRHVREEPHPSLPLPCLIWTGTVAGTKSKYATFRATTKQTDSKPYAHRWIYEYWIGPIPPGLEIDHRCKRPLCVQVAHLEPVEPPENMRRVRLDTCRSGKHDLTNPDNVRWDKQGRRRGCIRCWLDRANARRSGIGGQ